jgi:two-component system, response regulator PdtaR
METGDSSRLRVRYSAEAMAGNEALKASILPLLEICLHQTVTQGAYVYRLDRENSDLQLLAWHSMWAIEIGAYQVQLDSRAGNWFLELPAKTVLEAGAWLDWRFQSLPEFVHNRFESVLVVALHHAGKVVGVANFCQRAADRFATREIAFLSGLSLPLGSLLAGGAAHARLESELHQLNRKLEDRKLIERAKGILQARFAWTEEQAYLNLRRSSRQSRAPMRAIARHVIERTVLPRSLPEGELR